MTTTNVADRTESENRIASDSHKPEEIYALALIRVDEFDWGDDVIRATSILQPDRQIELPFSSILRLAKGVAPGTPVTVNKGLYTEYTANLWFATDQFAAIFRHGQQPDDLPSRRLAIIHPSKLTFDNPQNEKSTWLFAPGCEPTKQEAKRCIDDFFCLAPQAE